MKKLTVFLLLLALLLGTLAGCQTPTDTPTPTGGSEPPTESGTNPPDEIPSSTNEPVENPPSVSGNAELDAWLADRNLPNANLSPNLTYEMLYKYDAWTYTGVLPFEKTAFVSNTDELAAYLNDCTFPNDADSQAAATALYDQLKDVDFSQKTLLFAGDSLSVLLNLSLQGLILQDDALIVAFTSPHSGDFFSPMIEPWGLVLAINTADLPENPDALVIFSSISFPQETDPSVAARLNARYGFSLLKSDRFKPVA